jgi:ATP-dependent DNA helicase HFM1/MER3
VIKKYSDDKPVLIFCCTRKSCEKTASRLADDFPHLKNPQMDLDGIRDKGLAICLKGGVGFHTAGLCPTDRLAVEQLFLRGSIRILCTTSTLAQGINLPANLVIIKGTKHYADNSLQEYDSTQILQMSGRAGRPQFHDQGTCVIMTETPNVRKFESILNNTKDIESCLMENLAEHLNAEVALGFIQDRGDVIRWLKSTYLYIRVQKNPLYYHLTDSRGVQQFLEKICMKHVSELERDGLVEVKEDGALRSLPVGSLCSQYGVMISTMVIFAKAPPPQNIRDLLSLLVQAKEFSENIVRQEERQKLRMMSADPVLRFANKTSDDVDFYSPETKVYILIESCLAHGRIDDWSLAQEFSRIKKTAERLLACMFELLVNKKSLLAAESALVLLKCISQQLWNNDDVRLAQQIKGIGEVYAKKIRASGCKMFADLRSLTAHQIERITNHRPGWGIPVCEEISRIPHYAISISEDDVGDGVQITVRNLSQQDPASQFHKADVLVGIEKNDSLLGHFKIKRVLGHMHSTFHVGVPEGFSKDDVTAKCIDSVFIGVDADTAQGNTDESTISSSGSKLNATAFPRMRVTAPDSIENKDEGEEDEVVIWQMKKPVSESKPITPNQKKELNDAITEDFQLDSDFWDQLEFEDSHMED